MWRSDISIMQVSSSSGFKLGYSIKRASQNLIFEI